SCHYTTLFRSKEIGKDIDARVGEFQLTNQFRIQADDEIVDWIDDFVNKKVRPIPDSSDKYELEVFDNAGEMFDLIQKRDEKHSLSRIVATFDYEHKKDGEEYYVEEIGFKGVWNTTKEKQTWAERPDTIKEVGSIYTVQGFDLNYVGVILGPSVSYDEEKEELVILSHKYKDVGAFTDSTKKKIEYNVKEIKEQIILNSINVLMKREVKGLYVYASDEKLRKALNRIKYEELLVEHLINEINKFRDERNWRQYHNSKDLALSLSLEASELLENFQWKSAEDGAEKNRQNIEEELADVFIYGLMMADDLNIDMDQAIIRKLKKNETKYLKN